MEIRVRTVHILGAPRIRPALAPRASPATSCPASATAQHDSGMRIFAEQVPGLTVRYAQRTTVLDGPLSSAGLALGGRAGRRLMRRLAAAVSRMTLLRLVRAPPEAESATPRVLGVDGFALRRHRYGRCWSTSNPAPQLLPDRSAETLLVELRGRFLSPVPVIIEFGEIG